MTPLWIRELADRFQQAMGQPEPFPRRLAGLSLVFPLRVREIAHLCIDEVQRWLMQYGIGYQAALPNRRLRGCLLAHQGYGFIFLEKLDNPEEKRFTLAHEVAHFLRDYLHPREEGEKKIGPGWTAALEGLRKLTSEERLHAFLRQVPIRPYVHLLDRSLDFERLNESEECADRLAFELLAPAETVLGDSADGDATKLIDRLIHVFGLPDSAARAYASILQPAPAWTEGVWRRILK